MTRFVRSCCCIAVLCLAGTAWSREYPDLFATPRMKSMGRAMTAIVDDYSALYVNPAGLAQMKTWELRLPDLIQGGVSPSVLDLYKKLSNVGGGSSVSDIVSTLSEFDGESTCGSLDVAAMGYYSSRIAVAINPLSVNGCFRIRTPSALFARIKTRLTVDAGLSLAFAHSFLENHVRVGVALRPLLIRGGMDQVLEGTDLLSLKNSGLQDLVGLGWGFDMDVGAQADLDPHNFGGVFLVRPLFGVALQNVVATQFSNRLSNDVTGKVPPLERKLNIGVGARAENFGAFRPTVSLELRDFLIATDSVIERVSAGLELALKPRKWFETALRGHFYKGNFGGGFGVKLSSLQLEFGTYAVNLGQGPGVGVDRLIYGQASLVW